MGEVVLGVGFFCGPTLLFAGLILAAHRSKRHVRDQLLVQAVLFNLPIWLLGLSYARLVPSDFIGVLSLFFFPIGALFVLLVWPVIGVVVAVLTYRRA